MQRHFEGVGILRCGGIWGNTVIIIIGTLGNIWWHNFYMGMYSDIYLERWYKAGFLIHTFRYAPCNVSHMFGQGSHMFAMFYVHAHMHYVKNGEYPSHITLTTFTQFAQNSTLVSMLALCGSTMHVATLWGLWRLWFYLRISGQFFFSA